MTVKNDEEYGYAQHFTLVSKRVQNRDFQLEIDENFPTKRFFGQFFDSP